MRWIALGLLGCAPAPIGEGSDGGVVPPTVVSISIGAEEVSPTAPIDLWFSEPIDETGLVEGAIVVAAGDIDTAFRSDLDNPPLTASRAARTVPLRLEAAKDGQRVRAEPLAPMQAETAYTLAVSRAVRDRQGTRMEEEFSHRFTTAEAEGGAPVMELVAPAAGASDVPTNVTRVLVRFSEEVFGVDAASLQIFDALEAVSAEVQAAEDWCHRCYEIRPQAELAAGVLHEVRAGDTILDDEGQPLFLVETPTFTTGPGPDREAPVLWLPEARVSGDCLLARWLSNEPATSEMLGIFSGALVEVHDLGAPLSSPGTVEFHVESADAADNRTSLGPLSATYVPGPRVIVTEVLANPLGPEPAQEWVEIANLEDEPVSLGTMTLADEGGEDDLPAVTLEPGSVGLIVGEGYDPLEGSDPPPGPDTVFVRVSGSLAHSGLRNSGERVELRDESGAVLSSYGGQISVSSEAGRSVVRVDLEGCDVRESWALSPKGEPTPGRL